LPAPQVTEIHRVLLAHLVDLYAFYGHDTGVKIARKHIGWYTKGLAGSAQFRHQLNQLQTCDEQITSINEFFSELAGRGERLTYACEELAA
jgi:tRNA-dihydrouridine synthase B